jgi:hypothetical protein
MWSGFEIRSARPVYPYIYLLVRMKLENHWMDFHEIRYREVLMRFLEILKFRLKSDKNSWHF